MSIILNNTGTHLTTSTGNISEITTTTTGTHLTTTTGINNISIGNYSNPSFRYKIMNKEFEYSWYSAELMIVLSLINTIGFEYYDNIKLQGFIIPDEIVDYLEKIKIQYTRNKKISQII